MLKKCRKLEIRNVQPLPDDLSCKCMFFNVKYSSKSKVTEILASVARCHKQEFPQAKVQALPCLMTMMTK